MTPMKNGILIVDKPSEWTSFDVLAKLRGVLSTRKLGHSGTLDPMATGVLAVFIGRATAAADRQLNHDKTYEATIRLGLRTDTGDVTGTALETAPVTVPETRPPVTEGAAETAPNVPQETESRSMVGFIIIGAVAAFLLLGMIAVRAGSGRGRYSKRRRQRRKR